MPKALILQKTLPHYRMAFFEGLYERLRASDVEFQLIYGDADVDASHFPWADHRPNRSLNLLGRELIWQPALSSSRHANLVVVEQASKLLINYYLQLRQSLGTRLAFWGHGENLQAGKEHRLAETIKKRVSTHAHWWFAYNDLSKKIVEDLGFPPERITNVQNAIDTSALKTDLSQISEADKENLKQTYGLKGDHIGLYCGRMYREKRIDFLLETAKRVQQDVPEFELVLIGAGPLDYLAKEAAEQTPWIHFVGPQFAKEKAAFFALSKLFLMPGLVGLAILDAFASGLPLVTSNISYHSPEIDYLIPDHNGVMTENSLEAYSQAIIQLLSQPEKIKSLRQNALETSKRYTIANMAQNFHDGILQALA